MKKSWKYMAIVLAMVGMAGTSLVYTVLRVACISDTLEDWKEVGIGNMGIGHIFMELLSMIDLKPCIPAMNLSSISEVTASVFGNRSYAV